MKLKDYLSADDRRRIDEVVAAAERSTVGEIVVRVALRADKDITAMDPHERVMAQAQREFQRLGVDKTRGRTGVLILVLVEEHTTLIYGDQGINAKLWAGYWDERMATLTANFAAGRFGAGIIAVVQCVGRELAEHFPRRADDVNEIRDEASFGDETAEGGVS